VAAAGRRQAGGVSGGGPRGQRVPQRAGAGDRPEDRRGRGQGLRPGAGERPPRLRRGVRPQGRGAGRRRRRPPGRPPARPTCAGCSSPTTWTAR
jgi:hypothetical protein